MIVSNSKKLIYLRVPRTGSTSLSNFLIENLEFSQESDCHTPLPYNRVRGLNLANAELVHATLDDIARLGLLRYPLEEYRVFAVIRDPVDRFLSSAWHACHQHRIAAMDNNQAVAYAWRTASPDAVIFKPQSKWVVHQGKPVNRLFAYQHIDLLAQEVLGSAAVRVTFQHRSESRILRSLELDDALRQQIIARYSEDQKLYEEALAKRS